MPDVPMSSIDYCKLHKCVVCGLKRVGSMIARGGVGESIKQMRQSSYSIGREWKGLCTQAFKATTSVPNRKMWAHSPLQLASSKFEDSLNVCLLVVMLYSC
jgi:hypothetical protein